MITSSVICELVCVVVSKLKDKMSEGGNLHWCLDLSLYRPKRYMDAHFSIPKLDLLITVGEPCLKQEERTRRSSASQIERNKKEQLGGLGMQIREESTK